MRYDEYNEHIDVIKIARYKIEKKIKLLEPEEKEWNKLLCSENKIVRKMYLDYITLLDMEYDAKKIDL